jgi:DNA end-binding protein Ku
MARGIWKGTLGFGLVSIGVELFTAEAPERLDIDLLDRRDMAHVGYQQINKTTGRPIDRKDVVRGIAVRKDQYVLIEDKELQAAHPEATQTIDILGFVSVDALPPIFLAKPYYVSPLKGSEKAYRLLVLALAQSKRVGLAQLVIRIRQYVAAVYPLEGALVVQLLRYADEIREPPVTVGGAKAAPRTAELSMARKLIDSMETDWDPSRYHDTYRDEVLKLIKRRASKTSRASEAAPATRKAPAVLDLVAALKKSLADKPSRAPGTRRKAATTRRRLRSAS